MKLMKLGIGHLMAETIAALVLTVALVRAVMWRLERLENRNPTARMKRGQPRRWWLLAPTILLMAAGVWWFDYPELARWMVALTAGLPFLLGIEQHWARVLRVDTTGWDGNINMGALAAVEENRDV